jgi:hypothetical protein
LEKALVFWETALINKGDRNNYHKDIDLIALPNQSSAGKWSTDYKAKLAKSERGS